MVVVLALFASFTVWLLVAAGLCVFFGVAWWVPALLAAGALGSAAMTMRAAIRVRRRND